jgi:predicted dehydrogenase
VTGLELESICADLSIFVPGRRLDDDGNVLLRFTNGAKGVLIASQIEVGCENDLRLRVFGATGTLEWHQEEPNRLLHAPIDGPLRVLTRGSPWLGAAAQRATRLPTGHPEAFIEAFANVYLGVAADIRAAQSGATADPLDADYPRLADGVRGVRFIEKVVQSAGSQAKWTSMRD